MRQRGTKKAYLLELANLHQKMQFSEHGQKQIMAQSVHHVHAKLRESGLQHPWCPLQLEDSSSASMSSPGTC